MSLTQRTLLAVSVGAVLGFALAIAQSTLADRGARELPWKEARLLSEVMDRVRESYVDEVSDERMFEYAVRGVLQGLDPHSNYLDPEDFADLMVSTSGSYTGVGIEVVEESGRVTVVSPIDDTPAARAGIRPGDVIVEVDGQTLQGEGLERAVHLMRGEPGTEVNVVIERLQPEARIPMALVRDVISVKSVRAELSEPGIGYIRISQFIETTAPDLATRLTALERENGAPLQGLVLDLRNNPGGLLDAAVEVSDLFMVSGLIVMAEGRVDSANFSHRAHSDDLLGGAPVVVLVNGGSASASEIVAGALQDNGRAVVMGEPTFGKGSVQSIMPVTGGSAIKLTTSRYFTPSGRSIQDVGVAPDVVMEPVEGQEGDPLLDAALERLRARNMAEVAS